MDYRGFSTYATMFCESSQRNFFLCSLNAFVSFSGLLLWLRPLCRAGQEWWGHTGHSQSQRGRRSAVVAAVVLDARRQAEHITPFLAVCEEQVLILSHVFLVFITVIL